MVSVSCFVCVRYRNFRTFASPRPVQFACLALDASSEVVSAGSLDTFEIFVWSMQTGKLLEVINQYYPHRHIGLLELFTRVTMVTRVESNSNSLNGRASECSEHFEYTILS